MSESLSQIVLVLVQPRDIVNVASIIRVMSNFGLVNLRLIEPAAFDAYRIGGIAHHTDGLIATTERYASLDDGLTDCTLVLGTTGRPRRGDRQILTPRDAAPLLLQSAALAGAQKVAVLFGCEQDGLSNDALDRCHGFITIPTHEVNRSLNLAQAALIVAYELWMTQNMPHVALPSTSMEDLAPTPAREAMFGALETLLTRLYPNSTDARLAGAMARLRTMLMRSNPKIEEVAAMTNLANHAVRALSD
jgi:TrmH family RNA methyltransferase